MPRCDKRSLPHRRPWETGDSVLVEKTTAEPRHNQYISGLDIQKGPKNHQGDRFRRKCFLVESLASSLTFRREYGFALTC